MGTPPVPPAGAPPQGPPGGGNEDMSAVANNLLSASVDFVRSIKEARDVLSTLPKISDDVGKKFSKASQEMKSLVVLADSAQDAFKGMSEYTKTLAKGLTASKNLKEVKTTLVAIAAASKKAIQSGLLDAKSQKAAQRAYDASIAKLKTYKGVKDAAFDMSGQEDAVRFVKELSREYGKLATQVGKAKFGKITEGVMGTRRNLVDAGIMKAGRVEKYAAYGEAAIKLKEAAKAKREDKARDFTEKREAAKEKLLAIPGMKEKFRATGMVTADGDIDWAKVAANRKVLAKSGGGGDAVKALQEATMAPRSGLMGKLTGGGMVEGAVGSVAGLVGQAAIPLAIAEAVKDLVVSIIDKNAEMNKQAETLASGGILTGTGVSGADALIAARQNLTPSTFLGMNRLGLGYDRNVKMAQAMVESGYNVEELGGGGVGGYNMKGEFGPGTFGDVQKIAATSGRVAGMGDAESVKMTMKLLMQYRQSMEGTGDFFTNLNKDTRAAGLSTLKYVSILQEITDQFDRMNKTVDQTSGVLRALSMTGRTTAEDLQENLKMILGDPKRDVGMQIYLDMMQRSSGQAGTNAKQQGQIFNKAAENAYQTLAGDGGLGMTGLSKDEVMKNLTTPEGREYLNSLLTTYQAKNPNIDVKKFQVAQGAINVASDEGRRSQLMEDFAKGRISAVDYQSAQVGLGKSAQVQANENLSAAKEVMRHSGISTSKLYEEGGVATTQKAQQLLQTFGLSPTLLRDTQMALQNQGQGRLKVAMSSEQNAQAVYDKLKDKMGEAGPLQTTASGKKESALEALERWTRDKRYGGKFMYYLRGADEGLDDLYNTNNDLAKGMDDAQKAAAKSADEEKARSAGAVTQNTAEIFANAFSSFFNEIISLLEKLRQIFVHSKLIMGLSGVVDEKDEALTGKKASTPAFMKMLDIANRLNEQQLAQLKSDANINPTDPNIQAKLKAAEARQSEFRQKYGPGSGLGQDAFDQQMADIKAIISDANDPVEKLMNKLGVNVDMGGGTKDKPEGEYTLTEQQMSDNAADIARWKMGGLVKVSEGKDQSGQTNYHLQTVNNYSASIAAVQAQAPAETQESTERAYFKAKGYHPDPSPSK